MFVFKNVVIAGTLGDVHVILRHDNISQNYFPGLNFCGSSQVYCRGIDSLLPVAKSRLASLGALGSAAYKQSAGLFTLRHLPSRGSIPLKQKYRHPNGCLYFWWPIGESNPCFRRERATSWPLDQWAGLNCKYILLLQSLFVNHFCWNSICIFLHQAI